MAIAGNALLDRLARGPVVCAEGYLFELERRGYIQAGAFVPEAVLDHQVDRRGAGLGACPTSIPPPPPQPPSSTLLDELGGWQIPDQRWQGSLRERLGRSPARYRRTGVDPLRTSHEA